MKKFLIATILVLSCSTACAEDVYLTFRDSVKNSPKADKAWKELIQCMDRQLKQQGHDSVKKSWEILPIGTSGSSQISMQFITSGSGSSERILGVSYVHVKNGFIYTSAYLPASDWNADWVARKILSTLNLQKPKWDPF